MDGQELLLTVARALAVYVLMLVVIRALGKRTVGNFAAFDLLVALMLGELVDEIIYGDVSFMQGTVAIAVIAGAQAGNAWLTHWGHGFDHLLEGKPTPIVRNGRLLDDGIRKERMNVKDVMAHLREQGITDVREVKAAFVEDDGGVSVLRRSWAEPARTGDVDAAAAEEMKRDLGDEPRPAGRNRTDAPEWLR
jgi:uncharacterized membrane protein YcaP (DUF421 family)